MRWRRCRVNIGPMGLTGALHIETPCLHVGFLLTPRFMLTACAGFVDTLRLAADRGSPPCASALSAWCRRVKTARIPGDAGAVRSCQPGMAVRRAVMAHSAADAPACAQARQMHAFPCASDGNRASRAGGNVCSMHQQVTSNWPAATAAQPLGPPHSGHRGAGRGVAGCVSMRELYARQNRRDPVSGWGFRPAPPGCGGSANASRRRGRVAVSSPTPRARRCSGDARGSRRCCRGRPRRRVAS